MRTTFRASRPGALCISAVALLALATASGGFAPALAGPDDGKIVTTRSHVDAPKAFWENNNFALKNYSNYRGNGPEAVDLDKTVNWVGKGWDGQRGTNQYIFTVGDSPSLKFLGEKGKNLYMAPALPAFNQNPIWAGLGADTDIPIDEFRDGTFVTDILSVDGPGTVEFFRYHDGWYPTDINRMLSSSDTGWHSWLLNPGSHTHNYTTLSKPGRYEITYRTVARSKDGTKTIQSKPTTLVWQAGGQSPKSGEGTPNAISIEQRYQSAPVGSLQDAGYSLSLAPRAGIEKDGNDKLTDIRFAAKDKTLSGALTLYNNGYFLTDLEVKNGEATWPEMLGSENSQIQAVFTPDDNHQKAARWISQPLAYAEGTSASVSSNAGEGTWPQKIAEPRNTKLSTERYTPKKLGYTISVKPSAVEGNVDVAVTYDDPNYRGFVRGGMYEEGSEYADTEYEMTVSNGTATQTISASEWLNGSKMVFDLVPHPDMNARTQKVTLDKPFKQGETFTQQGELQISEESRATPVPAPNAPSPKPVVNQPLPHPDTNLKQCVAGDFTGKYPLDHGHVDMKASLADGALSVGLKDDTTLINKQSLVRPLDSVVLAVNDNARIHKTERMNRPELDFLGKTGDSLYLLPQSQNQGIIWPGYNTESIDYSQVDGDVSLHLDPVKIPDGAAYGLYTDSLGSSNVLIDSTKKQTSIGIGFPTHVHSNWAFTKPGNYSFNAYYTAKLKNGSEIKSPAQQLSLAVGKQAVEDCTTEKKPVTFTDVKDGDQFYPEIQWLANQGITTSWHDGTYRPLQPVERGAVAAFLYRMAGSPEVQIPKTSPFTDVPTTHPFYKEIVWMARVGISKGFWDGTYRPGEPINRDAMAAFLYRFAGEPAFDAPAVSPYNDIQPRNQFYREISWLASKGISTGWADGTYRPLHAVDRDAMAAFLYRYKH